MTLGDTLEALAGAYLLKGFVNFHNELDRIQDVAGLGLISVFSTTISATIGTTTLLLAGRGQWTGFGALWMTWWIGDLLGALVVAPILLVWVSLPSFHIQRRRYAEGGVFLFLLDPCSAGC